MRKLRDQQTCRWRRVGVLAGRRITTFMAGYEASLGSFSRNAYCSKALLSLRKFAFL